MPFGDDNIETFRSRRCRTATLAMAFLFLAVAATALIPMEETDAVTFTDGDFEYITSDTAGLAVVTAYTGTGTDVVVPSEVEYEGVTYTVVLASDTFTYNTEITSVTCRTRSSRSPSTLSRDAHHSRRSRCQRT